MHPSFVGNVFTATILAASKRRISFFALLCLVVLQLGSARRAGADPTKPKHPVGGNTAEPAKPSYPVTGHIAAKYKALKGNAGPLGHPTSKAMHQNEGQGLFQTFEHGVIGWSPSTGPSSVQVAYMKDNNLHFEWSGMTQQTFGNWMVRWDLNGQNVGQAEALDGGGNGFVNKKSDDSGHSGAWISKNPNPGKYRLVVQGGIGGSKFLDVTAEKWMGWSSPIYIRVAYPKR
jgi:hypothetical protein